MVPISRWKIITRRSLWADFFEFVHHSLNRLCEHGMGNMGLQERDFFFKINIKSNGFKSNASLCQAGLRFRQSHNIIRDWTFNRNIKSMSEPADDLQLSVICRSQDWMWGPDTITGLWRSREVSNANWPVGLLNSVRCNAKHCLYYRSSSARFPLNPVYCSYVEQANQPALLTCKWLGYPGALIRDLIGLTLMKSKEMRVRSFRCCMYHWPQI